MKKILKNFITIIAFVIYSGCSTGDDSQNPEIIQIDDSEEVRTSLFSVAPARNCDSTNFLVGQSMELPVSELYGISGTVTIVSDCEIIFSNFTYNGLGPGVSIYGALNSDFTSGMGLSIPIDGRNFENETFSIFLPDDMSLDEINSFSIWCFLFDADFSSVNFQQ